MSADIRRDAYLGGRVLIAQPARGYRAGVDPVFLAAACPAMPGQSVLELGCGVGTALLCLQARVADLRLCGIERQPAMADLARQNAQGGAQVFTGDLVQMPQALKEVSFDHVIVNPPYFLRTAGSSAPDAAREAAMGEDTPLQSWTDAARRRLRPKGWLTLIQRPERLSDVLAALGSGFGDLRLLPIMPRAGRDASLFLLRARKGSRAPLRILSPVVMHSGAVHDQERQDYSAEIERVLRHPCAFPGFGDGGFVEH